MFARRDAAHFNYDSQRSAEGCRSAGVSPAILVVGSQRKNAGETPALQVHASLPT